MERVVGVMLSVLLDGAAMNMVLVLGGVLGGSVLGWLCYRGSLSVWPDGVRLSAPHHGLGVLWGGSPWKRRAKTSLRCMWLAGLMRRRPILTHRRSASWRRRASHRNASGLFGHGAAVLMLGRG